MRILLLPVTKSRVAFFCQRQAVPLVRTTPTIDERIAKKGASIWNGFETSDKKWKQLTVKLVNKLLETVPFEERCLRTIPPRNTWKRRSADSSNMVSEQQAIHQNIKLEPIDLVYPSSAKSITKDFNAVRTIIAKQTQDAIKTHIKQIIYCSLGLPLTIPIAINPFIPNFPAFYLIYRMWCNWKALQAARHLKYLSEHNQLTGKTMESLNKLYDSFDEKGKIDIHTADKLGDMFDSKLLKRELHHALTSIEKNRVKKQD